MVLLLGATGYIGQAFVRQLRLRGDCFIPLSRSAFDYSRFDLLFDYVRRVCPSIVINAAGFSGRPNMDACEVERMQTFQANTILPQTVGRVCSMTRTPFGHVSSAAIFSGAKVVIEGELRVEQDLSTPYLRRLFEINPEAFLGFAEHDEPNNTFRTGPCSFLAGTKALAEDALKSRRETFIWRAGLPFNEQDIHCNLLARLQTYSRVYDHITCVSHVDDFASACLDLVKARAPFGVYNIVNTGAVTTRSITHRISRELGGSREFEFWQGDAEFYHGGVRAPRSSCILDNSKLVRAGVRMRSADKAIAHSLQRWVQAEEPSPHLRPPRSSPAAKPRA